LWTYVPDDRPFAGPAPPAAIFFLLAGSHRSASEAAFGRIRRHSLQADAYSGFNDLWLAGALDRALIC
jgi:transposase